MSWSWFSCSAEVPLWRSREKIGEYFPGFINITAVAMMFWKWKASCRDVNKHLASLYPDLTRIEWTKQIHWKYRFFYLGHFGTRHSTPISVNPQIRDGILDKNSNLTNRPQAQKSSTSYELIIILGFFTMENPIFNLALKNTRKLSDVISLSSGCDVWQLTLS